ncbi:hypothetical protein PV732_19275 [Streptomyces europaeiscabiei]|uniref:hypothetical protein n=1 Tax=Streptomyces TaxID=1883 RepID=UPI0015C510B0|nr:MULTISPECIES: hypothetical protein [Streptomyces]MDX3650178.1 hypothetical protein [Streptomyces europaeiscabiei]
MRVLAAHPDVALQAVLLSLLPPVYVMSSHVAPDASVPDTVSGSASFAGTEVV